MPAVIDHVIERVTMIVQSIISFFMRGGNTSRHGGCNDCANCKVGDRHQQQNNEDGDIEAAKHLEDFPHPVEQQTIGQGENDAGQILIVDGLRFTTARVSIEKFLNILK